MNSRSVAVTLGVLALATGLWLGRDSALARRVVPALAAPSSTVPTGAALTTAGIHKCSTPTGVAYLDRPCPAGQRELAVDAGAVTVMSFPKPAPPPASAANGGGNALVQGFSPEEIDRARELAIDRAGGR